MGDAAPGDYSTPVFQTSVTDHAGNSLLYHFNQQGNTLVARQFTRGLRAQEPPFYETRFEYNSDGKVTRVIHPLGNSTEFAYDSANPDRFQQGNLLSRTRRPDAPRGGSQTAITTTWTYEPIYNRVRTFTDPRGNDSSFVPPNGGANSPARYTTINTFDYQEGQDFASLAAELGITVAQVQSRLAGITMNLGDVNGDGLVSQVHGNVIRLARPTLTLLPGSNEPAVEGGTNQPIAELSAYNQYGQLTSHTDPEGNVTQYSYNPENDPDGDGQDLTPGVGSGPYGYLRQRIVDAVSGPNRDSHSNPTPAAIQAVYAYNRVGNITRRIDGRGIATDFTFNQLDQVVRTTRAAAHNLLTNGIPEPVALTDFQYLAFAFYDYNGNVIHSQIEDRGGTSVTHGFVDAFQTFDILDDVVTRTSQVSDFDSFVTYLCYDANQNQTLTVQGDGNAASDLYDERNLLALPTTGALDAPSGTLGAPPGPTIYREALRQPRPRTMTRTET